MKLFALLSIIYMAALLSPAGDSKVLRSILSVTKICSIRTRLACWRRLSPAQPAFYLYFAFVR